MHCRQEMLCNVSHSITDIQTSIICCKVDTCKKDTYNYKKINSLLSTLHKHYLNFYFILKLKKTFTEIKSFFGIKYNDHDKIIVEVCKYILQKVKLLMWNLENDAYMKWFHLCAWLEKKRRTVFWLFLIPCRPLYQRVRGDNGLFITLVPKVIIRWLNNFGDLSEFWLVVCLSWVFKHFSTNNINLQRG